MKIIHSILIANRGEIASRVIRTCRKMGIQSVAVYSDADQSAPFVAQADTAVHLGESAPSLSYLNQDKIIEAAKKTGANAIHPGYGFLSENAEFANRCKQEDLIFIGPHPDAIIAMGSKSKAKEIMENSNVPVVPGYRGEDQSIDRLKEEAVKIGFPVLLKATAGGGGKGMRIVHQESEVEAAIDAAKRESKSAFGDDELLIEKYISSGRHIEFQIFGDQQGNAIHLLERECTIQRRYQKVVEESPSPILSQELRNKMGAAAVNAAKALKYDNAGTVEFIFDEKSQEFYFLEVNTRLQVEHPVTEEVCGLDLVQMQIESAQGQALKLNQDEVKANGYAIELRLYAEDPDNGFLPVTGKVIQFKTPPVEGLRVETAIESGSDISIYYDPMIAKLIVWDQTREEAHRKMKYVLQHLVCSGTKTNQNFLSTLFEQEDFLKGIYDTHFIEKNLSQLLGTADSTQAALYSAIACTLWQWHQRNEKRTLLRSLPSGWRNSFYDYQRVQFTSGEQVVEMGYRKEKDHFSIVNEENQFQVKLIDKDANTIRLEIDGIQHRFEVSNSGKQFFVHSSNFGSVQLQSSDRFPEKEQEKISGGYKSPMPSQIVKILVEQGQEVKQGEGLIVLSSMKMENTICAEEAGKVAEIYVEEATNVEADFLLLKLEVNND